MGEPDLIEILFQTHFRALCIQTKGLYVRVGQIVLMREIHIFDMDDTLLTTSTFADMIRDRSHEHVNEFLSSIKRLFMLFMSKNIEFKVSGDFIIMLDGNSGAPMPASYLDIFEDKLEQAKAKFPNPETFSKHVGVKGSSLKDAIKCLGVKDRHIVIMQIRGFHGDPETIGKGINERIVDVYERASNKMIITGRGEILRSAIEARLTELGLHLPNQGLYCYPENASSNIQQFKVRTILSSIEAKGWEKVHFYEDRGDWLEAARASVEQTYPHVMFLAHHVTNVHDAKSL